MVSAVIEGLCPAPSENVDSLLSEFPISEVL